MSVNTRLFLAALVGLALIAAGYMIFAGPQVKADVVAEDSWVPTAWYKTDRTTGCEWIIWPGSRQPSPRMAANGKQRCEPEDSGF